MIQYNLLLFQPVKETGTEPDKTVLRLVKEHELQKDKLIGSGAFGTVYSVSAPNGLIKSHKNTNRNFNNPFQANRGRKGILD